MSKYCKICYDAGKPDYLTHNIREWSEHKKCKVIVCNYLKNLECSNCGKKGHTSRYCNNSIPSARLLLPILAVTPVKSVKVLEIKKVKANMNLFDLFNNWENYENTDDTIGYTLDGECLGTVHDIVWGVGFKNNNSVKWAIECCN